ncbi:M23 family metallopeptidase [Ramlibacter sp. AW1]|uniref:M23 family metallopeptidase n=1 Tax=Ramlibacter aurantiacus TaxID=2801330 RepID=A0A936ZV47_9BURK|nr:M23 family metallopeptidase [Ramlibacter aurantiacus]
MASGDALLAQAAGLLQRYPRHVTGLIAALLLGGGGGAFAVASFGPDPADLPVRQVVESVNTLPIDQQIEALESHALRLFRSDTLRATDTVDTLLARLGLHDTAAAIFLRNDPLFRTQVLRRPGRMVTAEGSADHRLEKLTARWASETAGQFHRLVIERNPDGHLLSRVETGQLVASARLGSGVIRSSLFAAVDDAQIPEEVAVQVADILGSRVDFHRGLRKGDSFNIVYEVLVADGEPLRTGRVLSVEFDNNGKHHTAMWFREAGKKGAYYALDGTSLQSAYLASPMEFSRVTSGFSMRFHPILKQWRAHLGTDYGAPTGTPVRVVGDGVVEFAGWQNGFGNVVIVRHNASDTTLYAHLSRMDVRKGHSVTQGQRIGAVGATGWATGPHLHYEFRINGQHQDPVLVARKSEGVKLSAEALPAFRSAATAMRLKLDAAARVAEVASIE